MSTERATDIEEVHRRLRTWWDEDAATYDRSPSHSGSDPGEAAAWRAALARLLPPAPARILDAGAGTGAMSVLAAELGHEVTALDLAPAMLAEAERKAADRGVALTIVNAPATEPPEGPFDAVIERHMLWTAPDPVGALRAWRDRLAPGGRVVLLEGIWQAEDPLGWVRERLARAIRSIEGSPHDHHAEYDPEVLASLPLRRMGPRVLLEAVAEAGYRGARIERLRDVEWARSLANGWLLGPLERRAQFALVAEPAA